RHHLRHRRHLHATRGDRAEAAADQCADDHPPRDVDPRLEQRRNDRDHHPYRADPVAPSRSRRRREEAQCEHERGDRQEVDQVEAVGAHYSRFAGSRFLNISSIRSVTTNPPTTFAAASTTATKPTTRSRPSWCDAPATMIAPT